MNQCNRSLHLKKIMKWLTFFKSGTSELPCYRILQLQAASQKHEPRKRNRAN